MMVSYFHKSSYKLKSPQRNYKKITHVVIECICFTTLNKNINAKVMWSIISRFRFVATEISIQQRENVITVSSI